MVILQSRGHDQKCGVGKMLADLIAEKAPVAMQSSKIGQADDGMEVSWL
jgi:hypothetical protein